MARFIEQAQVFGLDSDFKSKMGEIDRLKGFYRIGSRRYRAIHDKI